MPSSLLRLIFLEAAASKLLSPTRAGALLSSRAPLLAQRPLALGHGGRRWPCSAPARCPALTPAPSIRLVPAPSTPQLAPSLFAASSSDLACSSSPRPWPSSPLRARSPVSSPSARSSLLAGCSSLRWPPLQASCEAPCSSLPVLCWPASNLPWRVPARRPAPSLLLLAVAGSLLRSPRSPPSSHRIPPTLCQPLFSGPCAGRHRGVLFGRLVVDFTGVVEPSNPFLICIGSPSWLSTIAFASVPHAIILACWPCTSPAVPFCLLLLLIRVKISLAMIQLDGSSLFISMSGLQPYCRSILGACRYSIASLRC
jgi:hypothetical protein